MAPSAHIHRVTALLIVALAALLAAGCSDSPSGPSDGPVAILVDQSGAGDFLTIQDGIDAAAEGDTVLVAPGVYTGAENRELDFGGVDIVLAATAGRDSTVIDCQDLGRAFYFHSDESSASVVDGFTVRNGRSAEGGAIYCLSSDPTIRNVIFEDNYSTAGGGAAMCIFSSPDFTDVTFSRNQAGYLGGALYCTASDPSLTRCVVENNLAANGGGGVYCEAMSQPSVSSCVFSSNSTVGYGGGVLCSGSSPTIAGSTFYANSALADGDGVHCINGATPLVSRTILAFGALSEAVTCASGSVPEITRCCVYGNAEGDSLCGDYHGNIFEDPAFCDAAGGEFTLASGSPCLAENNVWGLLVGAFRQGCEDPVRPVNRGTIVAIFK